MLFWVWVTECEILHSINGRCINVAGFIIIIIIIIIMCLN